MAGEPERLWNVADVAGFLGVPVATIYQWRYRGYGPREVRAWFTAQDDNSIATSAQP